VPRQISSYGATGGHEWTLISLIPVVGSGDASLCSHNALQQIETVTSRDCPRPGYNACCTFGRDGALRRADIAARCPYHKLDVRVAVAVLDEVSVSGEVWAWVSVSVSA
jgi:hypothetical protein